MRAILTRSDGLAEARTASMAGTLAMAEPGSPRRNLWDALAKGEPHSKVFDRYEPELGWRLTEEQRRALATFAQRLRSLTLPNYQPAAVPKPAFTGTAKPGQDPAGTRPLNQAQASEVSRAKGSINLDLRRTANELEGMESKGLQNTATYHELERRHRALLEKVVAPEVVRDLALSRAEAFSRITHEHADRLMPDYRAYLSDVAAGSGPAGVRPAINGRFAGWNRDEDVPLTPVETAKRALAADPHHAADFHQAVADGRIMTAGDLRAFTATVDQEHLARMGQPMAPGGGLPIPEGPGTPEGPPPSGPIAPIGGPPSSGPPSTDPWGVLDRSVVITPEAASLTRMEQDIARIQAEARKGLHAQGVLTAAKLGLGVVWAGVELTAMGQGGRGRDPVTLMMLGANSVLSESGDFVRHLTHNANRRDEGIRDAVGRWEAEQRQIVETWREEARNQMEHLRHLPVSGGALDGLESAMLERQADSPAFETWKADHRVEILTSLAHQLGNQPGEAEAKAGARLKAFLNNEGNQAALRSLPVGDEGQRTLQTVLKEVLAPVGTQIPSGFTIPPQSIGSKAAGVVTFGLGPEKADRAKGYAAFLNAQSTMDAYLRTSHAKVQVESDIRTALARPGGIDALATTHLGSRPADRRAFEEAVANLRETHPGQDPAQVLTGAYEKKWAVERDLSAGFIKMSNEAPTHAQLVVQAGVTPVALLQGAYGKTIQVPDGDVELVARLREALRDPANEDLAPKGWSEGTLGGGRIGLAPMQGGQTMVLLTGYDPHGRHSGSTVLVLPGRDQVRELLQTSQGRLELSSHAAVLQVAPGEAKGLHKGLNKQLETHNANHPGAPLAPLTPQLARELEVQISMAKTPSGLAQAERLPGVFTYPRGRTVLDPRPEARLEGDLDLALGRAKLMFDQSAAEILNGRNLHSLKDDRVVGNNWVSIHAAHTSTPTRLATVEQGMPTEVAGHQAALEMLRRLRGA